MSALSVASKPGRLLLRLRQWIGAALREWPRYRRLLNDGDVGYLSICNLREGLTRAPDGSGYRCDWEWTSDLHAPKLFPSLGRRLMLRALADHPIELSAEPPTADGDAELTFIVGHRGDARLPHLKATLASIAAQRDVKVECIVVEQDVRCVAQSQLPAWVRYIHSPPPHPSMPYCRSWAFNIGVAATRTPVVVLHDNDMLVPIDYAREILQRVRQGADVVNLKRFIFYLGEADTLALMSRDSGLASATPEAITQNLEAGGSIAIRREAFASIGGMDESFIGWGGEDNEFWERAMSCRTWSYGFLPIVHLWHAPQPGKQDPLNPTAVRYQRLRHTDPGVRIERLRGLPRGRPEGPAAGDSWNSGDPAHASGG